MSNTIRPAFGALAGLLLALALTPPAVASESGSEKRGSELLGDVERGQRQCRELGDADFRAIGEFAMGRMIGSPRAHESMDELMSRMMGEANEERMHQVMGERFAGCGNRSLPAGFGRMMGAMGMMGGGFGGASGPGGGTGSMMGFTRQGGGGHNDVSAAWILVPMLILIVGAAIVVYLVARPRRRPASGPRDLLDQRFARGEIGADEYHQRRQLLEEAR